MRGSEKQVKWAEAIKENLIKTYRAVIPMMPESDHDLMEAAITKLEHVDYAGAIIEAYKGIRFTGDPAADIQKIMACHKNMMPEELELFMP